MRKGRGQPERWVCSGCVSAFCADSPKRVQAPRSDGQTYGRHGVCGRCAGSLSGGCVHSRPRLSVQGTSGSGGGGCSVPSITRSALSRADMAVSRAPRLPDLILFISARAEPARAGSLKAPSITVGGSTGGGDAGGVRGEGRRDAEPSGGHPGKAQGTSSTGDKAWRRVLNAGPAGGPHGVTLPAAPEGGLISFPRAAEVSAKCLSHLFKFYGVWPVAAGLRPGRKRVPGRRGSAGQGWPRQARRGSGAGPKPSELFGPQGGASMRFFEGPAPPRPFPLAPSQPYPILLLSGGMGV